MSDAENLEELMAEFKQHFKKLRLDEKQIHKKEMESMVLKQIKNLLGDNSG